MEDEMEETEALSDFEIAGSGITAPRLGEVTGDV
jgi:hypothetical protein